MTPEQEAERNRIAEIFMRECASDVAKNMTLENEEVLSEAVARVSYTVADAMIAQRKGPTK